MKKTSDFSENVDCLSWPGKFSIKYHIKIIGSLYFFSNTPDPEVIFLTSTLRNAYWDSVSITKGEEMHNCQISSQTTHRTFFTHHTGSALNPTRQIPSRLLLNPNRKSIASANLETQAMKSLTNSLRFFLLSWPLTQASMLVISEHNLEKKRNYEFDSCLSCFVFSDLSPSSQDVLSRPSYADKLAR